MRTAPGLVASIGGASSLYQVFHAKMRRVTHSILHVLTLTRAWLVPGEKSARLVARVAGAGYRPWLWTSCGPCVTPTSSDTAGALMREYRPAQVGQPSRAVAAARDGAEHNFFFFCARRSTISRQHAPRHRASTISRQHAPRHRALGRQRRDACWRPRASRPPRAPTWSLEEFS